MKNSDMPAMPCSQTASRDREEMLPYQFGNDDFVVPGLTKREHFAAMAMQGLCADPTLVGATTGDLARGAVKAADALLEELEKTE